MSGKLPAKILITMALILLAPSLYLMLSGNTGILQNTQPEVKASSRIQDRLYTKPAVKDTKDVQELLKEIEGLQSLGELDKANQIINDYISKNKSGMDKSDISQLEFELERSRRIALDYPLKEDELFGTLSGLIKNLSRQEFAKWQSEGIFDVLNINGQKRFMKYSKSNLFFRYPELKSRKIGYKKDDAFSKAVLSHIRKIKSSKPSENGVVRLPHRTLMSLGLTLNKGAVPSGKDLRCWLPYPMVFENQDSVKLVGSSYPVKSMDKENSSPRSVYFEAKSKGSSDTRFDLQFYYTAYTFYRKLDVSKAGKPDIESQVYRQYTKEEPHAVFTEDISKLSKAITGSETNPYLKGKRIYEWICGNMKYSYAAEYSTIRNISSHTLERRYGDCGQEALLFITLCRASGIPARWQSGFLTFPEKQITHDWAEIYIEPYGWLPVDPYMGIYFTSVTEDLSLAERKEIRDFYYGNIDYYRMVANKGHSGQLNPAKRHIRSDNVDFQRGELESTEKNLYFNEWRFSFKSE